MDARDITVTLDLRVSGDALAGSARDEHGTSRAFTGWLGLVAAIDELVGDPAGPCPDVRAPLLARAEAGAGPSAHPVLEEDPR